MDTFLTTVVSVSLLACVAARGAEMRVGAMPSPAYADLEASSVAAMPVPGQADQLFKLTLTLDASMSNKVEAVLGTGAQGDPDGTALAIGWDAGEWFIRGEKLRRTFSTRDGNRTNAMARTLTAVVRLGRGWHSGEPPASVTITERGGGAPARTVDFGMTGTSATLRAWFDPRRWETVRVVSRGQADASAVASAAVFYPDGTVMILR